MAFYPRMTDPPCPLYIETVAPAIVNMLGVHVSWAFHGIYGYRFQNINANNFQAGTGNQPTQSPEREHRRKLQ